MKLHALAVGHDAEVFATTPTGEVTSAIGRIGGTKECPLSVPDGALQEDNVLAELNIHPAYTEQEFIERTVSVMHTLASFIDGVSIQSSHLFTKDQLKSFGPGAVRMGCDPDYDSYTRTKKQTPSPFNLMRAAGGHIHVELSVKGDASLNYKVARSMDVYMGMPSIIMDKDVARRQMYGQAGSMRHKPYGVEYRTLSNFWLQSTILMSWVYNAAVLSVDKVDSFEDEDWYDPQIVKDIINTGDVDRAMYYCDSLEIPYEV